MDDSSFGLIAFAVNPFLGETVDKELYLCKIDSEYLKYLHSFDNKVSVKYTNRPFVCLITMINDKTYALPLTSQTTQDRKKRGKKKRANIITTFIKDSSGEEISNILHNNMIPVSEINYVPISINAQIDTYESNEIRYIRKHKEQIIKKAQKVYEMRIDGKNKFICSQCCDFKLLEEKSEEYNRIN